MTSILAADIGGTHSRFAAFATDADGRLQMKASRWLDTQKAASFEELLARLASSEFPLQFEDADIAVFAVAGPVTGTGYSRPPNIAWDIDLSRIPRALGLRRCELINDFSAQAYACRSPVGESARPVLPGRIDPNAPLGVIGAGTGLGQAALLPVTGSGWMAVSSEGGHASFPFETPDERGYMTFLLESSDEPYVRAETVVSGQGLSSLHQYLSGRRLKPAAVAAELTPASETVRWMARFFGRLARNLALQWLAFGGVYIAGGVAAKVPDLVTHPAFAATFHQSTTMVRVLKRIPVFLVTNEESGLWGAALSGIQALRQGRAGPERQS
jgi:glucokinase